MNRNIKWKVEHITVNQSPHETNTVDMKLVGYAPYSLNLNPYEIKDLCVTIEDKLNITPPRYSMPYSEFAALKNKKLVEIDHVIHNPPATIVFWTDRTKTVVKAQDEDYDPEKGIAMAFVKKIYDNKGSYYNNIKKWVEPYYAKLAEEADEEIANLWAMFMEAANSVADKLNDFAYQMREEATNDEKKTTNPVEEVYRDLINVRDGGEDAYIDLDKLIGLLGEVLSE